MKAANLSQVEFGGKRHELYRVLPLNTPYTVFIEASRNCNFRCKFCAVHEPNAKQIAGGGIIRYEDFTKVIDDMKGFPEKVKSLILSNQGEPLLNKRLADLVRYANQAGVAESVSITTNGSLLTPETSDALVAAGLSSIRISVEGMDSEAYKSLCGADIDWDVFVQNIKYLYEHKGNTLIYVKIMNVSVPTAEQRDKFFATFGDICDDIFVEHLMDNWPDFEGIYDYFGDKDELRQFGRFGQQSKGMNICPFPFYMSIINPNGTVIPCCGDWKQKVIFGNAFTENFCDIWQGEKRKSFLHSMIKNGRIKTSPELCAKCARVIDYESTDRLDGHEDALMSAFGL